MAKIGNIITVIPLVLMCAQYVVTGNNVTYHTMLYVKISNYTAAPSSGPIVNTAHSNGPNVNTATVTCCRSVPLVNCSHFCETVFSLCVDRCNNTVNITYTYRNNYIGENYGVLALDQRFVTRKRLLIRVYERRTDIRTGSRSTTMVDSVRTSTPISIKQYLWYSRLENMTVSNFTTISLGTLLFCESNWFSPAHGCNQFKSVDELHMLTFHGDSSLACNYKGNETSKIEIITSEPYKYTRDILMAQIAAFVADKVCSSATHSMTQNIVDVHYVKPILRVVFWSECIYPGNTDNIYLEFSDLKVFQALLYMTPYEERRYFSDPLKRIDISNTKSTGHYKLLFKLKSYANANHTFYTKNTSPPPGYDKHQCPEHGCTPAFKITYERDNSFISHDHLFGDKLTDCFGHLVNTRNTSSSTGASDTILLNPVSEWMYNNYLEIYINHQNKTTQIVGDLKISLDNITNVGSNYQQARPILLTQTLSTGLSVVLEVIVWCSNGKTGNYCRPCKTNEDRDCNIGKCLPQGIAKQPGSPDFHCRYHGQCINGTCMCPNGKAGFLCGISSPSYVNYVELPGTQNIENVVGNTTQCASGYMGYNCDRVDYCDRNPCKHGTCSNTGGWYSCNCSEEYMGYHCDLKIHNYCSPDPCLNGGTCTNNIDSYTCTCPEGYSGTKCAVRHTKEYHNILYVKILEYIPPASSISPDTCCRKMPIVNCTHFCLTEFTICVDGCKKEINITYTYNDIPEENYNFVQLNVQESPSNISVKIKEIKTDIITGNQTTTVARAWVEPQSIKNNFWIRNTAKEITFTNGASTRCYIKIFCESNWFDHSAGCTMTMPVDELYYTSFNAFTNVLTGRLACTADTSKIVLITLEPYKYTRDIVQSQLADFITDKVCSTNTKTVHVIIRDVRYIRPYLEVVFISRCTQVHNLGYIEFSDLKFTQALMFMSPFEERHYFTDPVVRTDSSGSNVADQVFILLRVIRYSNPSNSYYTQNDGHYNVSRCPEEGCIPVFQFNYNGSVHTLPARHDSADELHDCFGYLIYDTDTTDRTNNTLLLKSNWPPTQNMTLTIYTDISEIALLASFTVDLNTFDVGNGTDQALSKLIMTYEGVTNVSVELEIMTWCANGFTGKTCVQCCKSGNCSIPIDSSECAPGYTGFNCNKTKACEQKPCVHGTCTEQIYGYDCKCQEGFHGYNCDYNEQNCKDNWCQHGGQCTAGYYGSRCENDIDECEINICENNSSCIDGVNNYTCNCAEGFGGSKCNINIDDCLNNLCENNGTCIDGVNKYSCICADGFEGSKCRININDCLNNPCENNGTCIDGVNKYSCICADGFEGSKCRININDCLNNPCENNGTCIDGVNKYSCICADGFEGSKCRININDCLNNPCENNGTCIDGVNKYSCICADGFEGSKCRININDCLNNPCENNGSCIDGVNKYSCICADGFEGSKCRININDCLNNPCENNGTCIDGVNKYSCICADGFEGSKCRININDCLNNPCENNGTCIDGVNKYSCICADGFEGWNCSINIDDCRTNPYDNCSVTVPPSKDIVDNCIHGFCLNGATCVDHVGSFQCLCADGFDGKYCQNNIDDCEPITCQNGGSCEDRVNGYTCYCREGVVGIECEIVVTKPTVLIVSLTSVASILLVMTVVVVCCCLRYRQMQAIKKKKSSNKSNVTEQSHSTESKDDGYTNVYSTILDSLTDYSTVQYEDDHEIYNVIKDPGIELNYHTSLNVESTEKEEEHVYLYLDKKHSGTVKYYNESTRANNVARSPERKPGITTHMSAELHRSHNASTEPTDPEDYDDVEPAISTSHNIGDDPKPYVNTNATDIDEPYEVHAPCTTTVSLRVGPHTNTEPTDPEDYDDIEPCVATTGFSPGTDLDVYDGTLVISERRDTYLKPKSLQDVYDYAL